MISNIPSRIRFRFGCSVSYTEQIFTGIAEAVTMVVQGGAPPVTGREKRQTSRPAAVRERGVTGTAHGAQRTDTLRTEGPHRSVGDWQGRHRGVTFRCNLKKTQRGGRGYERRGDGRSVFRRTDRLHSGHTGDGKSRGGFSELGQEEGNASRNEFVPVTS